jgi:hypothetical protein
MGVFPTISRKICEIADKKDGDRETELALKELEPVLAHIDFNKMLLQKTSDNIWNVLLFIKQGLEKEKMQDPSGPLRMEMLKMEISWFGILNNYAFRGVYFYLKTLRDLFSNSLRGSQYYFSNFDRFCYNYENLKNTLGELINNGIGKGLNGINSSGFLADEIVNIIKNNLIFEGNRSSEVVGSYATNNG